MSRRPWLRAAAMLPAIGALLMASAPAQASPAPSPGQQPGKYSRWYYPSQITYGPLEDGTSNLGEAAAPDAFLTLPFMGPHYITSIFDHCGPNYSIDGKVCRYDGAVASAATGGPDPNFTAGYAQTPGGQDYLYYDGHDGYDYGLNYEPVAAAAPGVVIFTGWESPGCHTCLGGLIVEISHGNGLLSYYGHLSRIVVHRGQGVRRGQVIARSGMTGSATGPHLHFGVYYLSGAGPLDPYGWSGAGPDPYAKDAGDLWLGGSPRFASIALPQVSVTASVDTSDLSAIDVSWSSPGQGDRFTLSVATVDGAFTGLTSGTGHSFVFHGAAGQMYWFWVSVTTDLGWTDANSSRLVELPRSAAVMGS